MGRGKIGDIVLSRSGGQQIARVRNRSPKNPKSNAQCYQRAIMATVMQAYAAGKAIFNHAFEGKSVGQGCMSEFLRLNAKALRNQVATEIESATSPDECYGKVVGPGVKVPVPNRYIVSRGSLVNNIMANNGVFINQPTEGETVKAWLSRNGFHTDDLLTLVLFAAGSADNESDIVANFGGDSGDPRACNVSCDFVYVQLRVKSAAFSSETAITGATKLNTIFDYNSNRVLPTWATMDVEHGLAVATIINATGTFQLGTSGVIRSHENSGLRSNCTMELFDGNEIGTENYGLTYNWLITAWKGGTVQVGDSDLILEGGGFDDGQQGTPVLQPLTQEWLDTFTEGDNVYVRVTYNNSALYQPIVKLEKTADGWVVNPQIWQAGTSNNRFAWSADLYENVSKATFAASDYDDAMSAFCTLWSATLGSPEILTTYDDELYPGYYSNVQI